MKVQIENKKNKQVLTIIITMVYALSIGSGLLLPLIINASAGEYPGYPDDGYLYETLEGNVIISNRTMMTLNQTVAKSGANIVIENVTWYFIEEFKIEEGAVVHGINSTFTSPNEKWKGFKSWGTLILENCIIMNTTTAVTSTEGTLSMNGTEIMNTDYGINITGSEDPSEPDMTTVTNSTIGRCIEGINLAGASAYISNNLFDGNQYGLNLEQSDAIVFDNTFKWSLYYGITYDSTSSPTMTDNIFDGKGLHYTHNGNWIPVQDLSYENHVIEISGDLTISGGISYSLTDGTLTVHAIHVEDGGIFNSVRSIIILTSGIWVSEGAVFSIDDGTIQPEDPYCPINVSLGGESTIKRTTFLHLQGDPDDELTPWEGGIEIFSDDVLIEESTISHCESSGICVYNCAPTINDNRIQYCGYAGIYWEGDYQPETVSPGDTTVLVTEFPTFDFGEEQENEEYVPPPEAPDSTLEDLFSSLDHLILDEMEDHWLLVDETSDEGNLHLIGEGRRDLEFGPISMGHMTDESQITENVNNIAPQENGYAYTYPGIFDGIDVAYINGMEDIHWEFQMTDVDVTNPNATDLLLRNRFGWSGGSMFIEDDGEEIHMTGSSLFSSSISVIDPSSGNAEYIFTKPIATYMDDGVEMNFDCSYHVILDDDFLHLDVLVDLTELNAAFGAGADEVLIDSTIDLGSDANMELCPLTGGDVVEISHFSGGEYHGDDIYFQKYDPERTPTGNLLCLYDGGIGENIHDLQAITDENENIMLIFSQDGEQTNEREIRFMKTDDVGNVLISPTTLIDTDDLNLYLDAVYRDGNLFLTWTNRGGNSTTMRQYGGVWDSMGNEDWSACLIPDHLSGKGVIAAEGSSFYVGWSDGRYNRLGDMYVGKFSSIDGLSQGETRIESSVEADIPMEIYLSDDGMNENVHLLWAHSHSNSQTRLSYAGVNTDLEIQTEFTFLEPYQEEHFIEQGRKATIVQSEKTTSNMWVIYNQKQEPGNTVDSDLMYRIVDTAGDQITNSSINHYLLDTPTKMNVGTPYINTYELSTYQNDIEFEDERGFISYPYATESEGAWAPDNHMFHILPDAGLTSSVEMVHVGDEVTFDASASYDLDGSIDSYQWDYYGSGYHHSYDGESVTSATYESSGKYVASTLITDDLGLNSQSQKEIYVIPKPTATINPIVTAQVGEPVELDASTSAGYLDSCTWDIGDGITSDGVTVQQVFGQQGNYPVNLAVTDVLGMQDTRYNVVRVVDPAIHRLNDNVIRSSKYGIQVKNAELNLEGADIFDCEKGIEVEISCVALENSKIGTSSSYDIFSHPGSTIVTVNSKYETNKCDSSDGIDDDGDGYTTDVELYSGTDPFSVDTDGDGINDANDPKPNGADADGDGLGDDLEYPAEVKWYEAEDYAYDAVQRVEEDGLSGGAAVKTWTDLSTRNILTLHETELTEGWYKIYFRAKSDEERTIMVGVEGGLLPVQTYLMSDYYDWYSTPEFEFYGGTLLVWMGTYTGVGTEYVDRICIAKTKEAVTRFSDDEAEKELTYNDGDTAAVEGDLYVKIPAGREIDRATVRLESISLCELVDQGSVQHTQIRYGDPVNMNFKFDPVDTIVYSNGADTGYDVYFDGTRSDGVLTRSIKLTKFPPGSEDPLIYMGDPGAVDISQMPYTDVDDSFEIEETSVTFCLKLSDSDFGKIVMPQGYLGGFDWFRYTLVDVISASGSEVADDLIYGEKKNFNYKFDTAESSLTSGHDSYYDIYIDKTENGGIETYSVVLTKDSTEQGNPLICDAGINPDVEPSSLDYIAGDQSVAIGTRTGEEHSPIDGKTICLMMEDETYVKIVFPEGHQGYMNWYRYEVLETEMGSGSYGGGEEDYGDPTNLNYMFSTDSLAHYSGADTAYDVWFVAETVNGVPTYSVKLTKDPTQQGNPRIYDAGTDFDVSPSDLSYSDAIDSVATGTIENDVHCPIADKTICVKLDDNEYGKLVFLTGHQEGFQWYHYETVESELNYGLCPNQHISYREPLNLNVGFFPYVTTKADGGLTGYDIHLDVEGEDTRTYSVKLTKDPAVEGNPRIYDAGASTVINPTEVVEYPDDVASVDVGTNVNGMDNPEGFKTICIRKSEHEFVRLVFENGHLGGYEWTQFSMESSQQEQGDHSLANGDYYDDNNLNFRFSVVEPEPRSDNVYGPDDAFDVYLRMIDKGGGRFDYEVALTDPDINNDKRIHDADTNTLINPLEVEYTDEADSVVLGTLDGEQHTPIVDKTVCVQLGDGKYGKLVFPNGHLEEEVDGTGTGKGFEWYYYEMRTISGAFNVDIGDAPEAQGIQIPNNNILDIGGHLEDYRNAHQGDAVDGMLEVPISIDSNGDIEGTMLVKDLWIESFNEMALGQLTDPDNGDTDFDDLLDSRERNENLWWFEAEHYASENELVKEVDHRDASNNKAVQGIAGGNIANGNNYPIPMVNLLKSELLPVFSEGAEYQIYFRAKTIVPSKFQVKVSDSNNQGVLEDWQLVGTEYRWYRTTTYRPVNMNRFLTIEINAEREGAFFGNSEPTCGVYLDKIAVLRLKDESGTYTGVDTYPISDCMNSDTDEDGRLDGEEGGEVYEFEAEELTYEEPYQPIYGSENGFLNVVLESSNGRYVKGIDLDGLGIDFHLISPTKLAGKTNGNLNGHYRIAARVKGSTEAASKLKFKDDQMLLEDHDLTPDYRWYQSEPFFKDGGNVQLEVIANRGDVILDKIMIIKNYDMHFSGVASSNGQFSSVLDSDIDRDGLQDGKEINDNIWWFEAEHHFLDDNQLDDGLDASNGKYIKTPWAPGGGPCRILGDEFFRSEYPPGHYRLYVRAKQDGISEGEPRMYLTICEEVDVIPDNPRYHTLSQDYRWFVSEEYPITQEGRLRFQITAEHDFPPIAVDKFALVRCRDENGDSTGVARRVISDPVDPDTDMDKAKDALERNDNVWWFEAENHYAGGIGELVENGGASNGLGVNDPDNAFEVHVGLPAGKYNCLIRAKTVGGIDNGDLTFICAYEGGSSFQTDIPVLTNIFSWHQIVIQVDPDQVVTLTGKGALIIVDKVGLIRTEDGDGIITGVSPLRASDQIDPDTDREGLLDGEELCGYDSGGTTTTLYYSYTTDRDSDDDGLIDSVEVGKAGYDADIGVTNTNPLDDDSDNDFLPDGWIDGWGFLMGADGEDESGWGQYVFDNEDEVGGVDFIDDIFQITQYGWEVIYNGVTRIFIPVEGEDRIQDGEANPLGAHTWNDGGGPGETRGDHPNTDEFNLAGKLNDGEEIIEWVLDGESKFHPQTGAPLYLNPLANDDDGLEDDDDDGLVNLLEDVNGNQIWDHEVFHDVNSNGMWDEGEPYTDWNDNDVGGEREPFTDGNINDEWDDREPFVDWNENEIWDEGEPFTDLDEDEVWDDCESYVDWNANGIGGEREPFVDWNENGLWDAHEPFDDNGLSVLPEPDIYYTEWDGNGKFDGETDFENLKDTDGDGRWDYDEVMVGANPLYKDSDGDGLPDGPGNNVFPYEGCINTDEYTDPWNIILPTNPNKLCCALDPDSDGDGMDDAWEYEKYFEFQSKNTGLEYPINPLISDGDKDEDVFLSYLENWEKGEDGLTNIEEYHGIDGIHGTDDDTDPFDRDCDKDGLNDGDEVDFNTDQHDTDTDDDGLWDGTEYKSIVRDIISAYGNDCWPTSSNPRKKDTDGDELWDGDESIFGDDIDNIHSTFNTDPAKPDTDDDGLLDGTAISCPQGGDLFWSFIKCGIGMYEHGEYGYFLGELTGDRPDVTVWGNPTKCDTDDDLLLDGFDRDVDGLGTIDGIGEYGELSPHNGFGATRLDDKDTDDDGLWDGFEVLHSFNPCDEDTDDDLLPDLLEWGGWDVLAPDGGFLWWNVKSDPTSPDGDGDGLSDYLEFLGKNGNSPDVDGDKNDATHPMEADTDRDRLRDGVEFFGFNTNLRSADSDGDGLRDNEELSVVFRSNKGSTCRYDSEEIGKESWLAVALDYNPIQNQRTLTGFIYTSLLTQLPSNPQDPYAPVQRLIISGQSLSTPEGYEVYHSTDGQGHHRIYIKKQGGVIYHYEIILGGGNANLDTQPLGDFDDPNSNDNDYFYLLHEQYRKWTDPLDPDTDGDELNDGWEVKYNLDPLHLDDGSIDPDEDDLINSDECTYDTNPWNPDHDGDTMNDGWEVQYGLDPTDPTDAGNDPDGDGLTNAQEHTHSTDPNNDDTDGDAMEDGWEVDNGLDPLNDDSGNDPDNDGLTNLNEYTHSTDPNNDDTDGDAMEDGWEVDNGLDPLNDDSGNDPDNDGLTNLDEYTHSTGPNNDDTDGDTMDDGWEVQYGLSPLDPTDAGNDPDGDNLINSDEYAHGTEPNNADTDGDTMDDGWEVQYGLSPLDPTDAGNDPDGDNLINSDEYAHGTEPNNADTDGDGIVDGIEVSTNFNPNEMDMIISSDEIPWSGYWWPIADKQDNGAERENLYGNNGPMDKYDQYVVAKYGNNPGANEWESRSNWIGGHKVNRNTLRESNAEADYGFDINGDGDLNDPWDWNADGDTTDTRDASWWGHCHAWSAAATIMEPEPTAPVTRNGITFSVGDQKGLLSDLHYSDFTGGVNGLWLGTRYDDWNGDGIEDQGEDINDVYPTDFHETIKEWFGSKRKPVVMDTQCGNSVWNYPAYKSQMNSITQDLVDPSKFHFETIITFVTDGVDPDFVGHSDFTKTYNYWLKFENGNIIGNGAWEGASINNHPDFIWHPDQQVADNG